MGYVQESVTTAYIRVLASAPIIMVLTAGYLDYLFEPAEVLSKYLSEYSSKNSCLNPTKYAGKYLSKH